VRQKNEKETEGMLGTYRPREGEGLCRGRPHVKRGGEGKLKKCVEGKKGGLQIGKVSWSGGPWALRGGKKKLRRVVSEGTSCEQESLGDKNDWVKGGRPRKIKAKEGVPEKRSEEQRTQTREGGLLVENSWGKKKPKENGGKKRADIEKKTQGGGGGRQG